MSVECSVEAPRQLVPIQRPDYTTYDRIVIAFSGGKDSLACLLHLLDSGCPREAIELWHHDVDGEDDSLMDWRVTRSYCKAVADAFGVPIHFSWREGGFLGEMLRQDSPTGAVVFESPGPDGFVVQIRVGGDSTKLGTRLQFPQMSANLAVRWCSAYLKIDVASRAIINQARFNHSRTLFVTGERAEESAGRARYSVQEPHRTDRREGRLGRVVDQWRPIHAWSTAQVWDLIGRWKVNPHPCYRLGWGRASCAACIFGSSHQWASLRAVDPMKFSQIEGYEAQFGKTIDRTLSVGQKADKGRPYEATAQPKIVAEALSDAWAGPVFLDHWELPAGALSELDGPC